MKDRIPTKPGRIQLVPSPDDDDIFVLTRADEPTQEGTFLNKASLLSDATAQSLDLPQLDPTVNDALASVASRYSMIRTGTDAPTAQTPAKKGDIYVQDDGGKRRLCYICDADGEVPADIKIFWEQGSLNASGANDDTKLYRVRSDLVRFPAGTVLSVSSGFQFALYLFTAGREYSSTVALRTSSYTFASAQYARVLIARVTEDTSESASVSTFSGKLSIKSTGRHWTPVGAVREVEKEIVITESGYFYPPDDLQGQVTIRAFGGGAGGSASSGGYGGGGGNMAVWTGTLSKKRYAVTIGAGGAVGGNGGSTTFRGIISASGGSGANGGSGGGGGSAGSTSGGNGSYGGGGGGYTGVGGNGGPYGGGGGGGFILASGSYTGTAGGSGKDGTFMGGAGWVASNATSGHGGGGGGYAANGSAASSSANGDGGAGANTNGFSLDFEGSGTAGTSAGGGGGYGGNGGNGSTAASGAGGGGGGYGTGDGGNGGTAGGGGGGGWGGKGGNGNSSGGGGGGGYGLAGNGGAPGVAGGLAAGGGCGAPGGHGVVVITYTGLEVVR